mmetsp:Transcript_2526/g.5522  ORF Transcript_2526/g.5522 Transcript_2526/m.5522 type:complete len:260 (+) Transcript_2526:1544-2323(+)
MPTRALTVTSTGALALSRFMTTEMSALTVCSISPRSSHTICRRARSSASSRSFSARAASRSARSAASCAALASASAFNRASSLAFSSAFFRRNSARISSRRFSSSSAALASASACIRANVSCRSRSRASSSSRTRRRSFSAVSSRSLRSARNSASRTRSSSVISRAAPLEPAPAPAPAPNLPSIARLSARTLHIDPHAIIVPTTECASSAYADSAATYGARTLKNLYAPASAAAVVDASAARQLKSGFSSDNCALASAT